MEKKPTKGDRIRIQDDTQGISMTAVVDEISKNGERMTLRKVKEDK